MPLASELEALIAGFNAQPPMHRTPIAQLRGKRERIGATDVQPVGSVEDVTVDGPGGALPLRLYRPQATPADPLPAVLFFHGGGFVFGGVDGYYDHVCRVLCAKAACRVVSVDYRLAPEDPFPAASEDGIAALQWTRAHAGELGIDAARVFVAGGSAGANLAAVTAMRARDATLPPLRGQLLFYPLTDFHTPPTQSSLDFATGYYLTREDIVWFWRQYAKDAADTRHPYAAPLRAGSLAGLPPALVITAEFDPLRDEGEAYARRMREHGVPVTLSRYQGMVHGFLAFPTPKAPQALDEGAAWIRAIGAGASASAGASADLQLR